MGICFQLWNKIVEYDQRALVQLAALLNETNLSKRKRKHTVEYLLYINEAILLSLSVNNIYIYIFFFLEFAFTLISSFAIKSEKHKQSEKHTSFISQIFN